MAEIPLTKCSRDIPCDFMVEMIDLETGCQTEYERLRQGVEAMQDEKVAVIGRVARCPIIVRQAIEATLSYEKKMQELRFMTAIEDVERRVNEEIRGFEEEE